MSQKTANDEAVDSAEAKRQALREKAKSADAGNPSPQSGSTPTDDDP